MLMDFPNQIPKEEKSDWYGRTTHDTHAGNEVKPCFVDEMDGSKIASNMSIRLGGESSGLRPE